MEYTLKPVTPALLPEALRVEHAAMGDHCYLGDVYDYYTATKGELTAAFAGERLVGIGKFTVLWDGSGWLETLRVEPDWQRKGVGTALYRRYMEQARQYRCPALRMYTGVNNVASAALARRFGLERAGQFREYISKDLGGGSAGGFVLASPDEAARLLTPYFDTNNGSAVMNRTYYRLNAETFCGLAAAGMVWHEASSGSIAVVGARFQPDKGLHIGLLGGDIVRGLSLARALAKARGSGRLVCNFALENTALEAALKEGGFTAPGEDFITMEVKL